MVSRAMLESAALAGGALVTHHLYSRWPDIETRQWVFYVCSAGFGALTALFLLQRAPADPRAELLWGFGCWVALIEAAQVFGCGLWEFGNGAETDLCIKAFGRDGYTALCSAAIATVCTWAWRWRHG